MSLPGCQCPSNICPASFIQTWMPLQVVARKFHPLEGNSVTKVYHELGHTTSRGTRRSISSRGPGTRVPGYHGTNFFFQAASTVPCAKRCKLLKNLLKHIHSFETLRVKFFIQTHLFFTCIICGIKYEPMLFIFFF